MLRLLQQTITNSHLLPRNTSIKSHFEYIHFNGLLKLRSANKQRCDPGPPLFPCQPCHSLNFLVSIFVVAATAVKFSSDHQPSANISFSPRSTLDSAPFTETSLDYSSRIGAWRGCATWSRKPRSSATKRLYIYALNAKILYSSPYRYAFLITLEASMAFFRHNSLPGAFRITDEIDRVTILEPLPGEFEFHRDVIQCHLHTRQQ